MILNKKQRYPHMQRMMNRRCWCCPMSKALVKGSTWSAPPQALRLPSGPPQHWRVLPWLWLPQRNIGVICTMSPVNVAQFMSERQEDRWKLALEEHNRTVVKAAPNNAVTRHVWSTDHKIQWDEATGVDHDEDWFRIGSPTHQKLQCHEFWHWSSLRTAPPL